MGASSIRSVFPLPNGFDPARRRLAALGLLAVSMMSVAAAQTPSAASKPPAQDAAAKKESTDRASKADVPVAERNDAAKKKPAARTDAATIKPGTLAGRLKPLIDEHKGKIAVAVRHLSTGEEFHHQADVPMPTASLIKAAIMFEAWRQSAAGKLDFARMVEMKAEDRVQGSGVLTRDFSPGVRLPVRDLVQLMIVHSDNTATNLVIDQIGLPATTQAMESLGLANTKLHSKVFRRDTSIAIERSKTFGIGSTTAAEMVRLFAGIRQEKLLPPEICRAMLGHLKQCDDKDKLRRFLPPGTVIAHKTGSVNEVRTDAGIIESPSGPIAICVLTAENKDQSWGRDNAAEILIGEIGRETYRHFNPLWKESTPDLARPLARGSSGPRVAALQRTLAARLGKEAEALSADGDFGPHTEQFVRVFQKTRGLAVSGVADPATMAALGPLLEKDGPVADPKIVNAEKVAKKTADGLDGPPLVTCKAWAIADGRTGKVLWQKEGSKRLDNASTTKMMTCYIVLKMAEATPAVLDERLVFSKRADETDGSTADIREGESLPVREALYAMMLPSGNDVAVALAEHFGPRLSGSPSDSASVPARRGGPANGSLPSAAGDASDSDPLAGFIVAMNRTAKELGMTESAYTNPHGLSLPGHHSSCADLTRLAHAAWRMPLYRQIVATPRRGWTLDGPGGYRRNAVWKNTNELLGIEGYDGVKTGTTTAAGACLVSSGHRGDDHLFIAVLGSTSSDARYTDTRNLFRWAWGQRGGR